MKTSYFTSLLAAAAVSLPSLATAQDLLEPRFGIETDSTITFSLTITKVNKADLNGNQQRFRVRSSRTRISQKDFMEYIADLYDFDLPRGARLIIHTGSELLETEPGVYIANRTMVPFFNVSEYVEYDIDAEPVVIGNYAINDKRVTENSQTKFLVGLALILPVEPLMAEAADGEEGELIYGGGVAANRFTFRESFNNGKYSLSTRTSANKLQGASEGGDLDLPGTVEGKVKTNGKEKGTDFDFDL